jgi:hypothetical protein
MPDPKRGVVSGIVLCSDTGKPARFATVILTAVPQPGDRSDNSEPLHEEGTANTNLEGRFRIEAVDPGQYYVFAWMPGYLDPVAGLNSSRLDSLADNKARQADAIEQAKEHMVPVTVKVHREVSVTLSMDRAAEITGTIKYEDGTPASGMHFGLRRRVDDKTWTDVGMMESNPWVFHSRSDSHGHYEISDLTPGEYKICALLPAYDDETSATRCLGDTYRFKNAEIIKLRAGEVTSDVNFEVPISGMYTIAGTVRSLANEHPYIRGKVRLLYADDREMARDLSLFDDGGFVFDYVPQDSYILQFTQVHDAVPDPRPGDPSRYRDRYYADTEIRLDVQDNETDMDIALPLAPPGRAHAQKQ